MTVFALWSAPRTRSTVFFRSMAERGDMTVLHEPFCKLRDFGEIDAGGRTFDSPASLLTWLRDETHDMKVFVKDHPPTVHVKNVLAELPFIPRALTWEPGERPEWRQYARWHVDVSSSSGFERREHVYPHTVGNSPDLARFAAHHRPFYEQLYAQRLDVAPWE